jgi:hypothetical protein
MADLSNWEYTSIFSGKEAAALILGLDPSDPKTDLSRTAPLIKGMMQWYHPVRFFPNRAPLSERPRNLVSTLLKGHIDRGDAEQFGKTKEVNFEEQVFSADEIVRWLSANGMKSVYQFERSVTRDIGVKYDEVVPKGRADSACDRWPWGSHHTEMLGHLEAAARRYWVNHDPADTGTAPTNAKVSDWLQTERKVSKTMADSIASMLRLDGLPTGPRK